VAFGALILVGPGEICETSGLRTVGKVQRAAPSSFHWLHLVD